MNRILFIGNSGTRANGTDGQTVKVRLYMKKMKDEGFEVDFVELEHFAFHPFSTLLRIKHGIKNCDRIVLVTAERGSKFLIPYINKINNKYKKPFVFPLIGTSLLHYSIDRLTDSQKNDFLINENYSLCKVNKKIAKQLNKVTFVLPETEQLCRVFKNFYGLKNVYPLNNFRETPILGNPNINLEQPIKFVFLSRVMKEKGIMNLLQCLRSINNSGKHVCLDIYGKIDLTGKDLEKYKTLIDNNYVKYCGVIKNNDVINTLRKYDFLVFPTRFVGEGTPGVIVESLLAGVPILTSDFPQSKYLLSNGYDSIFFKMFDEEDLKDKILYILSNSEKIPALKNAAFKSGFKYTYEHERQTFLKFVCGIKEE